MSLLPSLMHFLPDLLSTRLDPNPYNNLTNGVGGVSWNRICKYEQHFYLWQAFLSKVNYILNCSIYSFLNQYMWVIWDPIAFVLLA